MQILLKKSDIITAVQSTFVSNSCFRQKLFQTQRSPTWPESHESLPPLSPQLSLASFLSKESNILHPRWYFSSQHLTAGQWLHFTQPPPLPSPQTCVNNCQCPFKLYFEKLESFSNCLRQRMEEWVNVKRFECIFITELRVWTQQSELSPARSSNQIYRDPFCTIPYT